MQYFSLTLLFRNFFFTSHKETLLCAHQMRDSGNTDASISSLPAVASSDRGERRGAIRAWLILKGRCHKDIVVLDQFCAEVITYYV